jgi:hypothetical protein
MSNLRGAVLSRNSEAFTYFRCEGFFIPAGDITGQNLFSLDEMTITVNTDTITKDDQQGPVAEQARIKPLKTTVEGSITFGNLGEFALRSAFNSDESDGYVVQAAVAEGTFTIPTASQKLGGVFQVLHPVSGLPVQNLSGIEVTWGTTAVPAAVAAVEGTDFNIDRRTGVIELLVAAPATATTPGNFVLTYNAAAIASAKGNLRMGIGSAPGGKEGSMHFLALNEDAMQVRIDLWDVLVTNDGAIAMQATSEFSVSKAKLSIQSVQMFQGKAIPKEFRFGSVIQLDDTALAA